MYLEIRDLLTANELARLRALSQSVRFVGGRISNPSSKAKDNLQADGADPGYAESSRIIAEAFARSEEFARFALPKHVAPPLLCKYEPGMKYGVHADAAHIMLEQGPLRSDLSSTVFLADPESYEGGELVIHLGARALPIKCRAGSAIVYPSTTLHEVQPVRSGARLVSITFIESYVADEQRRDLLFELGEIRALEGEAMSWLGQTRLSAVRENLMRMWSV